MPTYANYKKGTNLHIRVIELLELVGLAERMYHKSTDLLGGQCQRVPIARSLINTPSLIFAYEPTGNLDSNTGVEIMNIFLDLNKQGRTIVMITHDPDVARYAGKAVHLKDGKIENN